MLIIPLFIILLIIIRKRFVHIDRAKYRKPLAKFGRILLLLSRTLIILLLLIAMALPFTITQEESEGNPRIALLVDNSTSMQIFDIGFVKSMKEELSKEVPTTIKYVGEKNSSSISEGIYSNLNSRNIVLVTDGNNYKGKDLASTLLLAMSKNVSLNVISLAPRRNEISVSIEGPSKVVEGVENDFIIHINKAIPTNVNLKVMVDGEIIENTQTDKDSILIRKGFNKGRHIIIAEINGKDSFSENNVFRKTIKVIEKPKILFLTREFSPMTVLLQKMYDVDIENSLPTDLNEYLTIVINDMPASAFSNNDIDRLSDYVNLGEGLVVIGGENSFDYGDYKGSFMETILPVKVARGKEKPSKDVNVVLLIDISGSTSRKEELEKDIALHIMDQMEPDTYITAISFFTKTDVLSPLILNSNSLQLRNKINELRNRGGTNMHDAVVEAINILKDRKGSKNIIVIADGRDKNLNTFLGLIKSASEEGIVTHSVNIGENSDARNMKTIAEAGNGDYFKPDEAKAIEVVFDKKEDKWPLMLLPKNHFITSDMDLNSYVTGFNQVVPKSSGIILATTAYGDPILITGRYGLGRVAVLSTDDGRYWASSILKLDPKFISRIMNWGIENPERKKEAYIDIKDTTVGDSARIYVKASSVPEDEDLMFSKIDENLYLAEISERETGIKTVLGTEYAVNYHKELEKIGMNEDFLSAVSSANGNIVERDAVKDIIESAKQSSIETIQIQKNLQIYFVFSALGLLLLEIFVRRIFRYRKIYK